MKKTRIEIEQNVPNEQVENRVKIHMASIGYKTHKLDPDPGGKTTTITVTYEYEDGSATP
jgi:hypothetical protein